MGLKYGWENEKRWERLREAIANKEVPVEVNCFGTKNYKLLGQAVKIYNEKLHDWQVYEIVEHYEICPVDGTFMLVRAVKGTTYLPLCSRECVIKYLDAKGLLEEAIAEKISFLEEKE